MVWDLEERVGLDVLGEGRLSGLLDVARQEPGADAEHDRPVVGRAVEGGRRVQPAGGEDGDAVVGGDVAKDAEPLVVAHLQLGHPEGVEHHGQAADVVPLVVGGDHAVEPTASMIFVPAMGAADAIMEATDAGIPLVTCITEGIPASDMAKVARYMDLNGHGKTRLVGDVAFEEAGAGASPFASRGEAVNAVFDALFYVETVTKDIKLAEPLGLIDCGLESCPSETALAGGSDRWIRANLAGYRALFTGGEGTGLDDLLVDAGHDDVAAQMLDALDRAEAAADALNEEVSADPTAAEAVHVELSAVATLLKGDVATVYTHPISMGSSSNAHYGGNAKTYMNVGLAMGEAMVKLLKGN